MKPLIPIPLTLSEALDSKEEYICAIQAKMGNFPLCCSSGVLNNLRATPLNANSKAFFAEPIVNWYDESAIDACEYIHDVIKLIPSNHMYYPLRVARWNALSKIFLKAKVGSDDNSKHSAGYAGYKCSNVMMADRIVADKRDKRFAFSSYDVTYSVDHLMDWLELWGHELGEVFVSKAVPGGHGARCRSAIITPNVGRMEKWHEPRLTALKEYVHTVTKQRLQMAVDTVVPADKIAASW